MKIKKMCGIKKEDIEDNIQEICALITKPKYICAKCARVSNEKSLLCKAVKIKSQKK